VSIGSAGAAGGRRRTLEAELRAAIRGGRLRPEDRLPSTRALAADLGLARGTVADAYAQLAAEGYLRTSPGAPTRVAAGTAGATAGAAPPAPAERPPAPLFDLRAGRPDVDGFPRQAWLGAIRRALATAPAEALASGDPRGRDELRGALAGYLGRARGVLAGPDRVVACAGVTQGLALLCQVLRDAGVRAVAMEDPCLDQHRAIAAAAGLRVLPLPVDEQGARPEVPAGAGAVLVTPAHQFPLGGTLAPRRRAALVAWARATGGLVVEDD
jgi:GntR family transcriptional regulator/MocR family aminotransferase